MFEGIYCINCGLAYASVRLMAKWDNDPPSCLLEHNHTWSREREDGLVAAFVHNDPDLGEIGYATKNTLMDKAT